MLGTPKCDRGGSLTKYRLETPLSAGDIERLVCGDLVFLSGDLFTARDKAHAILRSRKMPISLEGAVLYHCGPLVRKDSILSAGPTTSSRMDRYTKEVLDLGVKAIIGKGGLAKEPFRNRAVYLAYPGGCGAAAARQLKIKDIHFKELGMAEALWQMEADDLGPMVVAIDAHGGDLYERVRRLIDRVQRPFG